MKQERAANMNNVNWLKLQIRQQEEQKLRAQSNWRPATYRPHPRQADIDRYAAIQARKYSR